MLAVMTRRRLAHVVSADDRSSADRLPLVAAFLGIVWNVGAMMVFATRDFGVLYPVPWVAALAYTALGFLPAVVVQSTLRRSRHGNYQWLVAFAYLGSTVAGVFHGVAAVVGEPPSSIGLLLLTVTYAVILAVMAFSERRRPGFQRTITAVALAVFAVSALHLSRNTGAVDQAPWPIELIGHHASLPLVLAILYQDYRFAFADLFLKRAISLLLLVGMVSLAYATLAAPLLDPHAAFGREVDDGSHLFSTAALLALWTATALAYPLIRRRVHRFVDRVILRRTDYRELRDDFARQLALSRTASDTLNVACTVIGRALGTRDVTWTESDNAPLGGNPTISLNTSRTQARITIPTTLEPTYEVHVAEMASGRVLLSDDLSLIDTIAALVCRRIDEMRLEEERLRSEQRDREMRRLATEAELRALRAQLNPHFLFNTLNTLGHLMGTAPDRAKKTLYQLTHLLRAVLRKTDGQFVALSEELEIVEAYLAIEHERFEERLTITIDVPEELRFARVPPLIVQPLVENAVKHGIAPRREGGAVTVRARHDVEDGDDLGHLRLLVIDTGLGFATTRTHDKGGVGLANVEGRLRHYFGASALMMVGPTPGGGTTVEICLPWIASREAAAEIA